MDQAEERIYEFFSQRMKKKIKRMKRAYVIKGKPL